MDVFIVRSGIVENIAVVDSMGHAQALFADALILERTPLNQHLNPGDIYAIAD